MGSMCIILGEIAEQYIYYTSFDIYVTIHVCNVRDLWLLFY